MKACLRGALAEMQGRTWGSARSPRRLAAGGCDANGREGLRSPAGKDGLGVWGLEDGAGGGEDGEVAEGA